MDLYKFNEWIKKFDLPDKVSNGMHSEIAMLSMIEALLDIRDGNIDYIRQKSFIVPPWLYAIKEDSTISINVHRDPLEFSDVSKESMKIIKEKRPFLRIIRDDKEYILEVPKIE